MQFFIHRTLNALLLLICLTAMPQLNAAEILQTVEIESRQSVHRQAAFQAALKQYFVRQSGAWEILEQDAVIAAVESAENWVSRYAYRTKPLDTNDALNDPLEGLEIQVYFDAKRVDNFYEQLKLPRWTTEIPKSALAWIVVRDSGRHLLTAFEPHYIDPLNPDNGTWQDAIRRAAIERGFSVYFPEMDLADREKIRAIDVWSNDVMRIQKASARYPTDYQLVARIEQNDFDSTQTISISLQQNATILGAESWVLEQALLTDNILSSAFDWIGTTMIDTLTLDCCDGDDASPFSITVSGIRSLDDQKRLRALMATLFNPQNPAIQSTKRSEMTWQFHPPFTESHVIKLLESNHDLSANASGQAGSWVIRAED